MGERLRKMRERRGVSLLELANLTGLSVGYLSRIENGARGPSWSTLCRIGEAWDLEPVVHFVTPVPARADAELFRRMPPIDRLCRTNYAAFEGLRRVGPGVEFVVTGAAAAVLHGLPVEIDELQLLVSDDDDTVQRLVDCLLQVSALYQEISVQAYRQLNRTRWVVDQIDADIRLVDGLPPTTQFDLDGLLVRAIALPDLVESDPVAAVAFEAHHLG